MRNVAVDLHVLAPFNQLKIFCAGAWHNFVLVLIAWLLVSTSSIAMKPLFVVSAEGGAIVSDVSPVRCILRAPQEYKKIYRVILHFSLQGSALEGHLCPGERITQLNEYLIDSKDDWDAAFKDLYSKNFKPRSFCAPKESFLAKTSENLGCCGEFYDGALQCWETLETTTEEGRTKFCFAASKLVQTDQTFCASDADCGASVRI